MGEIKGVRLYYTKPTWAPFQTLLLRSGVPERLPTMTSSTSCNKAPGFVCYMFT